ncbi:fused MFS/spermidine synthase [archaeon AH-315-M20]|nr:fused MFS/spermidine synthase [archaeon AH-315-M20]
MKLKELTSKYYLYVTVFITGAVILILEILGTRIIAPYYGTTIYVWSSLISVTLVALALGYFLGGWLADKKPESNILYLIILFAALAILLIPLITNFVLIKTNVLGARFGALMSATILFTIPLILLGMIAPYAIKLKTKGLEKVGITAGSLYGIATVGSFAGAILTGFYLIPNFGINAIIYLISSLLILITCISFVIHKRILALATAVLVLVFIIVPKPIIGEQNQGEVKVIYETQSAYAKLKVIDELGLYRYLFVNGATHTWYQLERKEFILPYLRLFEKAITYHSNPKDILVIGLGGGGIDKTLENYNLAIDNIEIDPKIAEIARKYFNFNGKVIIDDGRHYIRNTNKKYDIVFLDVYSDYSIYPYLFSKEAFEEIKNILNNDGILVINTIVYEDDLLSTNDKAILSIHKTLKEIFPHVFVQSPGRGLTNFVFYASDAELSPDKEFYSINVPAGGIILTDNYNPIESFIIKTSERLRIFNIERFGNEVLI